MATPKFFSDLGKTCRDLISPKGNDYNLKQPTLVVKSAIADPKISFTTKFEVDNGEIGASFEDKCVLADYGTAKLKLNTNATPSIELENSRLVDGLTLIAKTELNKSYKFTTKYRRDMVAFATDVELKKIASEDKLDPESKSEVLLNPSIVVALDPISIGASAALKPSAEDVLDDYTVALEYNQAAFSVTARVLDKLSKVQLNFAYQVNDRALLGGEYTIKQADNSSYDQNILAAGTYKFSDTSSVMAKVCAKSGNVNAVFRQQLSDQIAMSMSTQFKATDVHHVDSQQLGIKLVLGDN